MEKPLRAVWFLPLWLMLALVWPAGPASADVSCLIGPLPASVANGASVHTMAVNMFGRPEVGWAFYVPLIAADLGTSCEPQSPGFAAALARWQTAHHLPSTGMVDAGTLGTFKQLWQAKRPFVIASRHGCPAPPAETELARATPAESYGGKLIQLRADALAAYRRMVQAARAAGVLPAGSNLSAIFSGYRSPDYDAARCAMQHNCQGVVRAKCSAHRTGYAMDIYLGSAPGFGPDSSADPNRLFMAQTPFYRWLVQNGPRFHLVNYPFEPWHWEFAR